jgi:hypothetical protein
LVSAEFAAKYPFVSGAKAFLQQVQKISAPDLERAQGRVLSAIERRDRKLLPNNLEELSSYALARVLLAVLSNYLWTKKFGSEEAKRAERALKEEEEGIFILVAGDLLPSVKAEDSAQFSYSVSLTDFLKNGGELANAELEHGRIFLKKDGLARLLRKVMEKRITDFSGIDARKIPALVKESARELEEMMPKETGAGGAAAGFRGKYLSQECIQKILSGMPEGKRFYGAMALAIACWNDRLPRDEAIKVMDAYAKNCRRATHPFTLREAINSLDWVYRKRGIRFSCKKLLEQGLIEDYCSNCVNRLGRRGSAGE